MMVNAACLSVNAQDTAPTKPFEDGLKESVVLRADDVVFRPIRYSPWMTFTLATQISCSNDT